MAVLDPVLQQAQRRAAALVYADLQLLIVLGACVCLTTYLVVFVNARLRRRGKWSGFWVTAQAVVKYSA